MGGWIPQRHQHQGSESSQGEGAQDGTDMGEFGEDEERVGFFGCVALVQMEDDTNEDMGRVPGEDWVGGGLHVADHKAASQHDNNSFFPPLFRLFFIFTYQLLLQPWIEAPELSSTLPDEY